MRDFANERADILVVDDEPINIKIAKRMLSEHFDIREASSGEEALALVADKKPDLILLDVYMPGLNGHDVINYLKANPETMDIPVVFATADEDRETEANGLKEGASDFITKPFRHDILVQRLSRIIELSFLQNNLKEEVARQTASAEERRRKIERMSIQIISTLANSIDAKDQFSKGHSIRVSHYSVMMAQALGWDEERITNLKYAALLHDIGKIGIPDTILNNPKSLTENEYEIVKNHTIQGGDMLKSNLLIVGADDVAMHHHERYDGAGYPEELAGDSISTEARIVAITDAYDAMKSRRAYRKAYDDKYIREELLKGKGTQFDPFLIDVFFTLWDAGLLDTAAMNEYTTEETMEASSELLQQVMLSFVEQNGIDEIDIITGLLNRTSGESKIANAMQEEAGCFVFFDVDNLKKINDTFGHKAGDRILKLMGDTLTKNCDNGLCCRLGGDEFLMFIKETEQDNIEIIMHKIIDEFLEEKNKDTELTPASLSAGLVICSPDDTYVEVYKKADKALYHVKQNGKEGFCFYRDDSENNELGEVNVDLLVRGIRSSGSYEGAMKVEYRQFTKLFEYIANLEKRYEHTFKLVMITMEMPDNETIITEELERAINCMEQAIRQTVRNVDIVTRYSSVQLLVILLEATIEGTRIAMNRVFSQYYEMYGNDKIKPSFDIANLDDLR